MSGNVRDLRRRIRSVKSTQQITRAMKLVAASKLRRAQQDMERARPYAAGIKDLLGNLALRVGAEAHPLLSQRQGGKTLLVVITADRGLAGSFNTNVIRQAERFLHDHAEEDITLHLVGKKGRDYFVRRDRPIRAELIDVFRGFDFNVSRELAADLERAFLEEGFDRVVLLSNRFKSVMAQDVVAEQLLPAGSAVHEAEESTTTATVDYLYEPDPVALLEAIVPRAVETIVHQALLESYAAEMGARMVAMESATNNAEEMIARLTLVMNRLRQASITTEIIEIVSGAQALESH